MESLNDFYRDHKKHIIGGDLNLDKLDDNDPLERLEL